MSDVRHIRSEAVEASWTGKIFGTYRVESLIGRGATGSVFRAHDTRLDRPIALKFLRADTQAASVPTPERVDALQREALALAKLSHPNVVAVYELGQLDGRSFVSMEYIDGTTLLRWQASASPSCRAILRVLIEAGRGLAAAHSAGVVHRDIKPSNVLVGTDGRPRIVDFGLAVAKSPSAQTSDTELTERDTTITCRNGTPAYMAPEVTSEQAATAASDQYSFCVMGIELLTGERPSPGEPVNCRGAVGRAVRMLQRGLTADPSGRFSSMDALLTTLQAHSLTSRRPGRLAVVGFCTLLAVATFAYWFSNRHTESAVSCNYGAAQIRAVWSSTARQSLIDKLEATHGQPTLVAHIADSLDEYAGAWAAEHQEACLDTALRKIQPPELLDRRMLCLHRRLDYFRSMIRGLTDVDSGQLAKAAKATRSMPAPAECSARQELLALTALPTEPHRRGETERLIQAVDTYTAWTSLGKYTEAEAALNAITNAAAVVAYPPLRAAVHQQLGRIHFERYTFDRAREEFHQALTGAEQGGDQRLKFRAAIMLANTAILENDWDAGMRWTEQARASVKRLGLGDDSLLAGQIETAFGSLYWGKADYQQAVTHFSKSLQIAETHLGSNHPDVLRAHINLSVTLGMVGDKEETRRHAEIALIGARQSYGTDSVLVAEASYSLGSALRSLGRTEDSLPFLRDAVRIWRMNFGNGHAKAAMAQLNVGYGQMLLGNYEQAAQEYAEALQAFQRQSPPAAAFTAAAHFSIADLARRQGNYEKAVDHAEESIQLLEKEFGPDHPTLWEVLVVMGLAQLELEQWNESDKAFQRALRAASSKGAIWNDRVAWVRYGMGALALRRGRYAQALEQFEISESLTNDPMSLSEIRLGQSKATWRSGKNRRSAHTLALEAQSLFDNSGSNDREHSAKLEAWLAAIAAR